MKGTASSNHIYLLGFGDMLSVCWFWLLFIFIFGMIVPNEEQSCHSEVPQLQVIAYNSMKYHHIKGGGAETGVPPVIIHLGFSMKSTIQRTSLEGSQGLQGQGPTPAGLWFGLRVVRGPRCRVHPLAESCCWGLNGSWAFLGRWNWLGFRWI